MKTRLGALQLRKNLGATWLIFFFGIVYLVSQIAILVIVEPLGSSILRLQLRAFSAEEVLAVFRSWEAAGTLDAYRSHFAIDDLHWLWYTGLFTCLLCRLFESAAIGSRWNGLLVLPLASGLLDVVENRIQQSFLSSPDFSGVVDPLPLLSTVASVLKWSLVLCYLSISFALGWRIASANRRGGRS